MRGQLGAVIEELHELKREGVEHIRIRQQTLQALETSVKRIAHVLTLEPSNQQSSTLAEIPEDHHTPPPFPTPYDESQSTPLPLKKQAPQTVVHNQVNSALPAPKPFTLPEGSKQKRYLWLKDHILSCPVCNAQVKPGKKVVVGSGNLESDLFFCGEAPGEEEETQGEVFVGKAGQLLNKIIQAMGLSRESVYIGNIMNWRPDVAVGNRPPTQEEMAFCLPYLRAQIEIVQPKIIIALGKTAVDGLLGFDAKRRMGNIRGQWHTFGKTPLMITFHPSYLLHNNTNRTKRMVWEDMMLVMERVGLPISEKQRGYFL